MVRGGAVSLIPAVLDETIDDAFLVLLTLTDVKSGRQAFVANNLEDVVSRGTTFQAYPFAIKLPGQLEDRNTSAQLVIDNVDQRITRYIRSSLEPPHVKIEAIFASDPDLVERSIDYLRLVQVSADARQVSGYLEARDFLNGPAVDSIYSGAEFPSLLYGG